MHVSHTLTAQGVQHTYVLPAAAAAAAAAASNATAAATGYALN
jgi:hypothetical protein